MQPCCPRAAVLSAGAEPGASCASQSRQQLRSIRSSPGLWPGSPPHARQHVVKSQLQPVAPRRNLHGFRSQKCQKGICWPQDPPDPSDEGAAAPGLPTVCGSALPCPAPGHRAAYPHTRTGVWLCSVPSLVPFNTVPRAGLPASRPSESWAWPQWFGGPLCPLYPSVIPWHCSAVGSSHAQGGRGPVGAAVRLWFGEGSAEWMGPSQEPSQAAPPIPVYSVSTSVSHAEHVRGQTCVFI